MRSRSFVIAALVIACLVAAPRARADEQADFDKGRAAYATKNYEDADRRFREMLDPSTGTLHDPALVPDARMYWAAALFAMDRHTDAAQLLEKLLIARPEYEPDPLRFPQDVINFFIDTRSRIIEKINEAKVLSARAAQEARERELNDKIRAEKQLKLLKSMASQEIILERHSRLFALLPFGAGQFQNGSKALGWAFLGTESALFVAANITFPIYRFQYNSAADVFAQGDRAGAEQWLSRAATTREANLVLFGAFAATAIAGIVQAEVAFVPEVVEVRTRPVPTVGSIIPVVAPIFRESETTPGAAGIGGIAGGLLELRGVF